MRDYDRTIRLVQAEGGMDCWIWAERNDHTTRWRKQINNLWVPLDPPNDTPGGVLRALADVLETPLLDRPIRPR